METGRPAALSGRRAEAARNDARILEAARAVFVADPDAPISAVATRAGVGISALYRRYPSKEELLRKLCIDGLQEYIDIARDAVDDLGSEPWDVFARFMRSIVEADVHTLTIRLAGRFRPTDEDNRNSLVAESLNRELVARSQTAGVLREDVTPDDLTYVFEQVAGIRGATAARTDELRARYLTLHLDSLRAPGRTALPGPPPSAEEQLTRWMPS